MQEQKTQENTHLIKRVNLDYQHCKLIEFFLQNNIFSFQVIEAPSNYYDYTLEQRQGILGAADINSLCKTIVLENTAFDPKYESPFYQKYYCCVVQYTSEFNADKIAKFMKQYRNRNDSTVVKELSNKFFHFRLAPQEFAYDATGYRFNCITPFLMKSKFKIIFPENLLKLYPKYFWVGGGEIELKVGISVEEFQRLFNNDLIIFDYSS